MVKGVIFDFDGVIIDTERRKFSDLSEILKKRNLSIEESNLISFLGKKTSFFLKEKFEFMKDKEIMEIKRERDKLKMTALNKYKPIRGTRELLEFLKKKKLKLGICTGSEKKFVEALLKENSLLEFFDEIVTGEEFSSSKPSPECYLIAFRKMGLEPGETMIIEDSVSGVTAAKNAGAKKIFGIKTYLDEKALKNADKTFDDHEELLKYLKR